MSYCVCGGEMKNKLKNQRLKEELALPNNSVIPEEAFNELRELVTCRLSNAELVELCVALEVSRRISDDRAISFYKNRILGIIGVPLK